MQDNLLKLITLQDLDNKIRTCRQNAEDGPNKIKAVREKLTALEAEKAVLDAKLAANAAGRQELEGVIEELTLRKTTNQGRQKKTRSNNEYRAIMKEADTIAASLAAKEDELLVFMAEAEKLQALLPPLVSDIDEETALFLEKEADINKTLEESAREEAQAQAKRSVLVPTISAPMMSRYNTIAQNRDGQALSPVVQGMCRVCRLSIPPQLYNELQKNDKLLTCPNCARILYWMHHPYFSDFCTEPNPQAQPATADKKERKPRVAESKVRKGAKAKGPKRTLETMEDEDSDSQLSDDDRKVAHV
ncbi:MAG: C4-type zinc ribbon domain-containing protein [Deltaproteobacteria bacterium]|nr:C4-type zinc ribbon domain-containing protein [Deltaproteobacteria bacterium]